MSRGWNSALMRRPCWHSRPSLPTDPAVPGVGAGAGRGDGCPRPLGWVGAGAGRGDGCPRPLGWVGAGAGRGDGGSRPRWGTVTGKPSERPDPFGVAAQDEVASLSGTSAKARSMIAWESGQLVTGCGKSVDHRMFSMPISWRSSWRASRLVDEGHVHVAAEVGARQLVEMSRTRSPGAAPCRR